MKEVKFARVSKAWDDEMRKLTQMRLQKGLIKTINPKNLGLARATKRLMRCPSWNNIKAEYTSMPEREDD